MRSKIAGEFALIHRLTQHLPQYRKDVIVGVGDDCAVLALNAGSYLLATCDIQVANVHFLPNSVTPEQIGQKAIMVNISDIAAMGGKPTFCLISLIIPKNTDDTYIDNLYKGIKTTCQRFGIYIIGGNISQGKQLAVDIFMLGEVKQDELLLRSGAKSGNKVLVTGALGEAATGLAILRNQDISLPHKEKTRLIDKQLTPSSRLQESTIIAQLRNATAMIDISDGLASDLGHICNKSGVGVAIYAKKLPLSDGTIRTAKQMGIDPITFALTGGEDYELLFTAPTEKVDQIIARVRNNTGTKVSVIGEILPEKDGKWIIAKSGKKEKFLSNGWDHFQYKGNGI